MSNSRNIKRYVINDSSVHRKIAVRIPRIKSRLILGCIFPDTDRRALWGLRSSCFADERNRQGKLSSYVTEAAIEKGF